MLPVSICHSFLERRNVCVREHTYHNRLCDNVYIDVERVQDKTVRRTIDHRAMNDEDDDPTWISISLETITCDCLNKLIVGGVRLYCT
jgi:hypothetical protein